jgi:5-(carboxyamino)imidazole ribonucleotide synthase
MLGVPGAHVHLYGKAARPGRKIGHVTITGQDVGRVEASAERIIALANDAAGEDRV